ncbi:CopG family transcriptional regulator [Burkholderia cenocepacia]|uniref:CopG family transcriptional regulator n=1 Tax=Burkholderia cenocepacia TaxID=95486 RepID=UPI001BAA8F71|nr:CopG family transcriptional regulator [Burkholderia cenocepacia]QUN53144.1 CopG family transcriptional regulator [Burkholderia cenocepacia]
MAITKRPDARKAAAIDQFIGGAPDSAAPDQSPGTMQARTQVRQKKETISLGIAPTLLARVDAVAARLGISRAAAIAMAVSRFVQGE